MAVRETTRAPDPVDTAPQPGRRPVTSHSQISTIAIDLFTAKGFDETSVDDIAEAAGIARRTLFRYFPSKNAIKSLICSLLMAASRRHGEDEGVGGFALDKAGEGAAGEARPQAQ